MYLRDDAVPHAANPRRPQAAQRGLSPAARNLRWRVLAAFWTFLSDEGILKNEQRSYFSAGRVPKPKVPTVKRQSVEADDVAALLAACADDLRGLRDRALMSLLAQTGCRISELVTLALDRCDLPGQSALVHGKGGKDRRVYWSQSAADVLAAYLAARGAVDADAWLFVGLGSRSRDHLTADAARDMIKARAAEAGVTLPPGQPCHGFRRGFARRASRANMPPVHLQQILGHASLQYLSLYADELEDAPIAASYHAALGD